MSYTCYDGENDNTPDVIYGRIPADNIDDANNIVDKVICYEKADGISSNYFTIGTNIGMFQSYSQASSNIDYYRLIYTSEQICNLLTLRKNITNRIYSTYNSYENPEYFHNMNPIPTSLRKPSFNWDGTKEDIITAINNKTFYVYYGGHGASNRWANPSVSITDLNHLNNNNNYPIIFSDGCHTGQLGVTSIASEFIGKPNAGCAAIFAPSHYAGAWSSAEGSLSIFKSLFSDNVDTAKSINLGSLYRIGSEAVYKSFSDSIPLYHSLIYHWFGDPTMKMWIKKPEPVTDVIMYSKNGTTTINIGTKGLITLVKDGVVSSYSGTQHSFYATLNNNTRICVTRDNCIPLIITPDEIPSSATYTYGFGIKFCAVSSTDIGVKFSLGPLPSKQNTLSVFDINGNIKYQKILTTTETQAAIPVVGWPSGTYIISLNGGVKQDSRTINL